MKTPQVLSFREFRAGLAATFKHVQAEDGKPVFVGAHRKPEAVVMSVSHYQHLVAASERREAVTEALASVRVEGLEPSADDLDMFTALGAGQIGTDELRARVLARYDQ